MLPAVETQYYEADLDVGCRYDRDACVNTNLTTCPFHQCVRFLVSVDQPSVKAR